MMKHQLDKHTLIKILFSYAGFFMLVFLLIFFQTAMNFAKSCLNIHEDV